MEDAGELWRLDGVFNSVNERETLREVFAIDATPTVELALTSDGIDALELYLEWKAVDIKDAVGALQLGRPTRHALII
jgi:hypothetical protein